MVITAVPGIMASFPAQSGWIPTVQEKTNYLLTPGALASVVITHGRVHDIDFPLLFTINAFFYSVVVYLVLALAGRLFSGKRPAPAESAGWRPVKS